MPPKELLLVLDTNTHVHFRPFTEVDWCSIFAAKRIRLLVPLIVLDELDKIKNEHKFSHIRRRAQTIANLLDNYIDEQLPEVRRGVILEFIEENTTAENLNLDYNDNKLIACLCSLKEKKDSEVILITHDSGLTRRAKMRRLKTGKLPDDLKIEFVDESDKKYKELEQKHRKLEKAAPDLQLKFENEEQKIERLIQPPAPFPNWTDLAAYSSLKQEFDEKIKFCQTAIIRNELAVSPINNDDDESGKTRLQVISQPESQLEKQIEKLHQQLGNVPHTEFVRFINESNVYLQNYWSFLEQKTARQHFLRKVLEIKLVISNDGLIPASEIEIDLTLPEDVGVIFLKNNQFPSNPLEPYPPAMPRMSGEIFGEVLVNLWNRVFQKKHLPANEPVKISQTRFEESVLVRISDDQKRLKFNFKKLKHTQKKMLMPLYLYFDNFDDARSFHFDFSLLADNTPEENRGKMHVIINKPLTLL